MPRAFAFIAILVFSVAATAETAFPGVEWTTANPVERGMTCCCWTVWRISWAGEGASSKTAMSSKRGATNRSEAIGSHRRSRY